MLYKMLSILLDYPDREFFDHWEEMEALAPTLKGAEPEDRRALAEFMERHKGLSLTAFQAQYVQTFDLTPDHSLYLTHHLFEEQDRARGATLIRLSQYFQKEGLAIGSGELPDYLPLLLEYVSHLQDPEQARRFLKQTAQAVAVIAENLEKSQSPYASLLRIVARHSIPRETTA